MYAGFWRRFAAFLTDSFILTVIFYILMILLVIFAAVFSSPKNSVISVIMFCFSFILPVITGIFYFAGFEASQFQATPGKLIVGIKVTDLEGHRLTFLHSLGRYFAKFITALTFGAGWVMAGLTATRQALHDKIAGTYVVVRQDEGTPIDAPPGLAAFIYTAVILINLLPFILGLWAFFYVKSHPEKLIQMAMARSMSRGAMGAPGYNQADIDKMIQASDRSSRAAAAAVSGLDKLDFSKDYSQADIDRMLREYSKALQAAGADSAKPGAPNAGTGQATRQHGVTVVPATQQYVSASRNGQTITTCIKIKRTCCFGPGCDRSGYKVAAPANCCS